MIFALLIFNLIWGWRGLLDVYPSLDRLYRWVRVYDDWDARERGEQMTEWAEDEDDPDSYEIPKLEPDLPACLRNRKFPDRGHTAGDVHSSTESEAEKSG